MVRLGDVFVPRIIVLLRAGVVPSRSLEMFFSIHKLGELDYLGGEVVTIA